ncbi:MAG: VOC family protein [Pseudomonadota bacterium]
MARVTIEHVNLTVSDPERTAGLFKALFGWEERWRGPSQLGGHSIHVGEKDAYVALYSPSKEVAPPLEHKKGRPLNHVGLEVEDLDAVERRVIDAGLEPFSHGDYEPGRRFYFFDWDGIEYEIVSYA